MVENTTVLTHKCPNCAGALTFNPTDQKFHCEYCLSVFSEQEVSKFEEKQASVASTSQQEVPKDTDGDGVDDIGLFICPNCAAQIVTETTTAATTCYFCHNPVVLNERLSGEFLPEKVIPFLIDKKEAEKKFLEWTAKKRFVPKAFFNKEQIKNLTGVYFPYFLVDSKLHGSMKAKGVRIRSWVVGDIEYTETKQYRIYREGDMTFFDLVKNALRKNTTQKMVTGVQPFDFDRAIPFKNQYLAGFQAEKRDLEFSDLKEEIDHELKEYGTSLLREEISGYTTVSNVTSSLELVDQQNSYVLLPVWLVTYRDRGSDTLYYYAMNGQTGKTSGVLPISRGKLAQAGILIFILVLILALIGGWFI
ncbi:hypothetical protein SAMN02745116_00828 [Pilibacter termitis]|uniref:Replication restart DNA helicase PriA n=1 Tax=Pilibacter termitis TaxID=263852 RepID=A0A1T4LVW0_9ENTE|nr:ATP-binding protein [Pilibacter termitis]SJZ58880.1 hypothetical protein SAMN02745116_00828 [Pilibacter termitis]